jgi:hypothetical protein
VVELPDADEYSTESGRIPSKRETDYLKGGSRTIPFSIDASAPRENAQRENPLHEIGMALSYQLISAHFFPIGSK